MWGNWIVWPGCSPVWRKPGGGFDLLVMKGNAAESLSAPRPAASAPLIRGVEALVKALGAINQQRATPLRLREADLVRRLLAMEPQADRPFCQAMVGACLAVHPDDRLFPCGQTLGDERFEMGGDTASGDSTLSQARLATSRRHCAGCPLELRCPNDCPSRLVYNVAQTRHLACDLYRTLARTCQDETRTPGATASLHCADRARGQCRP